MKPTYCPICKNKNLSEKKYFLSSKNFLLKCDNCLLLERHIRFSYELREDELGEIWQLTPKIGNEYYRFVHNTYSEFAYIFKSFSAELLDSFSLKDCMYNDLTSFDICKKFIKERITLKAFL